MHAGSQSELQCKDHTSARKLGPWHHCENAGSDTHRWWHLLCQRLHRQRESGRRRKSLRSICTMRKRHHCILQLGRIYVRRRSADCPIWAAKSKHVQPERQCATVFQPYAGTDQVYLRGGLPEPDQQSDVWRYRSRRRQRELRDREHCHQQYRQPRLSVLREDQFLTFLAGVLMVSNPRRNLKGYHFVLLFTLMCPFAGYAQPDSQTAAKALEPPASWVDPVTGHKVVRISREPDSVSFYFNVNSYTRDGREMVYTTPDGISVIELSTWKTRSVVQGKVHKIGRASCRERG